MSGTTTDNSIKVQHGRNHNYRGADPDGVDDSFPYFVRANALEDNVVLYKVENGKRSDLPLLGKGRTYGVKVKVPSGKWGTLRVVAKGERFEIYLNGTKLFDVEDRTFTGAGRVGLWTKADSYTLFDNLTIMELK